MVSKKRNTGYSIYVNGKEFYLDVDFIWANYFHMFEQQNQILLASNHQIYQMYLVNYLSRITSDKKICFVANPYVTAPANCDVLSEYEKSSKALYKKLFILYSLRWRQKDCQWSESVIKYLSSISDTRKNNLYRAILEQGASYFAADGSLDEKLENFLIYSSNMQKTISASKQFVKKREFEHSND